MTAVVDPNPNKALVPPIPVSLAVATPADIANLPISMFDAVKYQRGIPCSLTRP